MPHKPVAVVVAMAREVAPLLRGVAARKVDGVELYDLPSSVIAVGGIGRAAARRAAEVAVRQHSPAILVSAGVAGALTADLHVGDVLQVTSVVDGDSGERFSATGSAGTLVTASAVSGVEQKRALAERWNADAVDMEASSVAQVAQEHGLEFAAVKAISDVLGFAMPPVGEFVTDEGRFDTARFVLRLAVNPRWWSGVSALSANTKIASVKLCPALQHLIEQQSKIAAG